MIVELGNFRFPIPFKSIELAERRAVERIHESRTLRNLSFLGEAKMSDRLSIILLSYFLAVLALARSEEENASRTVFYLCKSEQRKKELLYSAEKLKKFLSKFLPEQAESDVQSELRLFGDVDSFERSGGGRHRRLFILPVRHYLECQLQMRELSYWSKNLDACMQINFNKYDLFHRVCKKIDFLFLETNDLEGLLDDLLTIQISELHIFRAGVECNKLQRFYNFRFDNRVKVVPKKMSSSLEVIELKDGLEDENKSNDLRSEKSKEEREWFVERYDEKFDRLFDRKRENLKTVKLGEYASANREQKDFLECYFLMHLQTIFYLMNHLMTEYADVKREQFQYAEDFIKMLYRNTHLGPAVVKKLRKILIAFTRRYPPRVKGRELSTFYLQQVLYFFEKIMLWSEILQTEQGSSQQHPRKFNVFHFVTELNYPCKLSKSYKEQQIKLTTYNKKLLFDFLTDGSKAFCCFQNYGYSKDYYQEIFKYKKLQGLGDSYHCPVEASKESKSLTIGLIVNSTPNDEDLHINSEKLSKKEQGEGEERREGGQREHYWQIIRSYGVLIYDLCEVVSDGVVVYFPSKEILRECRAEWQAKENIYQRIYNKKKIFEESDLERVNVANVAQFKKLCDIGRGSVYFLSADSPFSKFQTFYKHYSKCVVFVGLPYPPIKMQAQAKFRQLSYKGKLHLFCFEEAMKSVVRCLSNCSNDPAENRVVIFADAEFRSENTIKKWLPMIDDGTLNTSTVVEKVVSVFSCSHQKVREREEREKDLRRREGEAFIS